MKKLLLFFLIFCISLSSFFVVSAKEDHVKILLNGQSVVFTDDSGFPYVDKNNRTMVPLRVTMEAAGFVVGYDSNKHTAIVICDKARIEVPIGTNKVYCNNKLIENDTVSVVNNGRTYLPIRAVLEAAGYTVEWDGDINAVKASSNMIDEYIDMTNAGELVPYSTSSLGTLVSALLSGKVVYINGQYFATPEYVEMIKNENIVYNNDVSDSVNVAKYPQKNRFELAEIDSSKLEWSYTEPDDSEWISESDFWRLDSEYHFGYVTTPDGLGYGFIKSSGLTGTVIDQIVIEGMPLEFADEDKGEVSFDGYRVKCVDGEIYFNTLDLKTNGIIE